MKPSIRASLIVAATWLALPAATALSDDTDPSRYIGSGSVILVHLHVEDLPVRETGPLLKQLIPEEAGNVEQHVGELLSLRAAVLDSGIEDIVLVMSIQGLPNAPGYAVIPKTPKTDIDAIKEMINQSPLRHQGIEVAEEGDCLVLGPADAIRRFRALDKQPRTELAAPLEAVAGDPIQIVLAPSADDRRVVEELMPVLPPQLGGGPSTHLTKGLQWAAIGVSGQGGLHARVIVQSPDPKAATEVMKVWQVGLKSLAEIEIVKKALPNLAQALPVLTPKVSGDQLTLELNEANRGIETLVAALKPPVEQARLAAKRSVSVNNLKQLALAMHNFHDTRKRFPAIGTYDEAGEPLLSWRVHLLPYLNHGELYESFRLNEPWDSPHNKKLLEKMPPVFACPQSEHDLSDGMATYRLVMGEDTVFPGREGISIREIRDGTSNTIMVVEVNDKHAVPWTKPEGLSFDSEKPLEGLGGQFPDGFNAAMCDGSVMFFRPDTVEADKWKYLFLKNDAQPVNFH